MTVQNPETKPDMVNKTEMTKKSLLKGVQKSTTPLNADTEIVTLEPSEQLSNIVKESLKSESLLDKYSYDSDEDYDDEIEEHHGACSCCGATTLVK